MASRLHLLGTNCCWYSIDWNTLRFAPLHSFRLSSLAALTCLNHSICIPAWLRHAIGLRTDELNVIAQWSNGLAIAATPLILLESVSITSNPFSSPPSHYTIPHSWPNPYLDTLSLLLRIKHFLSHHIFARDCIGGHVTLCYTINTFKTGWSQEHTHSLKEHVPFYLTKVHHRPCYRLLEYNLNSALERLHRRLLYFTRVNYNRAANYVTQEEAR